MVHFWIDSVIYDQLLIDSADLFTALLTVPISNFETEIEF